jgi:hypothetical protein
MSQCPALVSYRDLKLVININKLIDRCAAMQTYQTSVCKQNIYIGNQVQILRLHTDASSVCMSAQRDVGLIISDCACETVLICEK